MRHLGQLQEIIKTYWVKTLLLIKINVMNAIQKALFCPSKSKYFARFYLEESFASNPLL